jgi:hypothetical protein
VSEGSGYVVGGIWSGVEGDASLWISVRAPTTAQEVTVPDFMTGTRMYLVKAWVTIANKIHNEVLPLWVLRYHLRVTIVESQAITDQSVQICKALQNKVLPRPNDLISFFAASNPG